MEKEKAYMICDFGLEHSNCSGRVLTESGEEINRHFSSSFSWLRHDLKYGVDEEKYEIIDLIGKPNKWTPHQQPA